MKLGVTQLSLSDKAELCNFPSSLVTSVSVASVSDAGQV